MNYGKIIFLWWLHKHRKGGDGGTGRVRNKSLEWILSKVL